ncbi:MAG: hypothetical protein ACREQ8_02705 [Woeseiaceae bacterium]
MSKSKLPAWMFPFLVITNTALADTVTNTSASHQDLHFPGEKIPARGAFSCDFTFDLAQTTEPAGAAIERDRILMQRFVLELTNPDHPRMSESSPSQPDVVALQKISTDSPLGDRLAWKLNLSRVFDRSMFVLNVWLPYRPGDQGDASLWPNSPPFPESVCGDNVCVPSHGEHALSCALDCAEQCGNAICDAGEDLDHCPSDCEIPIANKGIAAPFP